MMGINGKYIDEKEIDPKIKELLLINEGATITKNLDKSISIKGPFIVTKYPRTHEISTTLINSGTITVNPFPLLYEFKNLTEGTLHVTSGCLEEVFTRSTQFTEHQQEKVKQSLARPSV
jgi:hypothetical protein